MQPNIENDQNNIQAQTSVPTTQPIAAPAPVPSPVVQTPTNSYSGGSTDGYIDTIITLFTNPKSFFDNPPSTFVGAMIFPLVNLVIMTVVTILTSIISTITMKTSTSLFSSDSSTSGFDRLTGDFWGGLLKGAGLSSLYAVLFIAAIAGIIVLFALITKKEVAFKDIFSMSSIFSLNFLAVAVTAIIGLLSVWVDNADFASVISLINSLIISLVFIYAAVLIIDGISEVTGFDMLKSAAILVVSTLLITFLMGKLFHSDFSGYFNISFGGYNSPSSVTVQSIQNTVQDSLKNLFGS